MLPGFEVIRADRPGGTFNGSPWKLTIHTTEGSSIDGAVGAYRSHGGWPHFTVDPKIRRKVQHYELSVSSRALAHPSGTPETNRAGAINVEVVGFAAQVHAWSHDWLTWLALEVLAQIRAVCPFALAAPLFVRYPDSYGTGAAQRFSRSEWAGYSGIVGHQHCPDNDHGDPGALDVTAILATLGGVPPKPPPEDFDMLATATAYNDETGEQLGFRTRDDKQVWVRNIEANDQWSALSMLTTDGKTAVKAASAPSAYFRNDPDGTIVLVVTVTDAAGVTWRSGAHGKPGQPRVWDKWYSLGGAK